MFKLAELFVQIGARTGPLDSALAGIRGKLSGLAGMRFNLPGAGLAGALGLTGLGVGLSGAMRAAVAMEDRVAKLGKAADLSGAELAAMKGQIIGLSTTLKGVKLDALFDIATSGAKMGVAREDLLRYTEGVAKVSMAIDDLPAGVIADQIGKLNSVFKLGVDGTMQFGSAIDKLADSGVSSASGILDVLARISGTAVVSRVSAQEATALAAALLDTGSGSELAATSLSRLIGSLNDAGARAGFLKATGRDANEFAKLVKDKPMAAIQEFLVALRGMNAAGQMKALDAIGVTGVQAQGEIQKLAQQADTLAKYVGLANSEFQTLNQITQSYDASTKLTSSSMAVAQNRLQALGDQIGSGLLPAVNAGLALLGDFATGVGGMMAQASGAVAGWGFDFEATLELVGYGLRNMGSIFERVGIMIGGYALNAWENLAYGGEVAAAVGKFIWGELVAAFEIVKGAGANLKDNLVAIFQEVWEYVKSGFTDPIEFKLKPIMEGVVVPDSVWKMPERKISDWQNILDAHDAKQAETDRKQADASKAAGAAARAGAAAPGAPAGTRSFEASKVGITDVDSYARELAEAAIKAGSGGDAAERSAKATEESAATLARIDETLKKNGTKTPAVFA